MAVRLSDHFTFKKLLKFIFPSVVMMIFTSVYSVIDGLFVSNFAGKTPFAALNLIFPVLMIFGAVGFMIGTGGSALVSKTLGEGDREKANGYFSLFVYTVIAAGLLLTAIGEAIIPPVARALGAEGEMLRYCILYGRIVLITLVPYMLQNLFQAFFAAAEKAKLGLIVVIGAGVTNILLDALFVAAFRWGLAGAAAATCIGQTVGGGLPIFYFARKNGSLLRLKRTKFRLRPLLIACANGSSEMLSNIAMSVVGIVYNFRLMKYAGENGVAAYGFMMYVGFIFAAIYIGYSIGVSPLVGYHYGAKNRGELKNLFKKSMLFISVAGLLLTASAVLTASPLSELFVGYDRELFEMTERGYLMYSCSFLLFGYGIFGSAFFTALNNGFISALISFLRTLVFPIAAVLLLPVFLGLDGIWLSVVAAEGASVVVTAVCLLTQRKKYGYA